MFNLVILATVANMLCKLWVAVHQPKPLEGWRVGRGQAPPTPTPAPSKPPIKTRGFPKPLPFPTYLTFTFSFDTEALNYPTTYQPSAHLWSLWLC